MKLNKKKLGKYTGFLNIAGKTLYVVPINYKAPDLHVGSMILVQCKSKIITSKIISISIQNYNLRYKLDCGLERGKTKLLSRVLYDDYGYSKPNTRLT